MLMNSFGVTRYRITRFIVARDKFLRGKLMMQLPEKVEAVVMMIIRELLC